MESVLLARECWHRMYRLVQREVALKIQAKVAAFQWRSSVNVAAAGPRPHAAADRSQSRATQLGWQMFERIRTFRFARAIPGSAFRLPKLAAPRVPLFDSRLLCVRHEIDASQYHYRSWKPPQHNVMRKCCPITYAVSAIPRQSLQQGWMLVFNHVFVKRDRLSLQEAVLAESS
jgi:hypothetical protein